MPYADDDSLSSSSSSSTDSDDEFLTVTGNHHSGGASGAGAGAGGAAADREAIVRKKLLESFYGAAVSAVVTGDDTGAPGADGGQRRRSGDGGSGQDGGGDGSVASASAASSAAAAGRPTSNDLDSPAFSATLHTNRHIRSSNVKTLLEEDESLALDIRSLDSTMQTLVYENYSKFIDATDAVRSIGQSVDTSEGGLARLATGIVQIESITQGVDDALRQSRSEVAEKLRLRRLLTRLDALLKLPTTLRTHIESGQTRLAARSHLNATAILGQHSAGFESLKSIEVECNAILRTMIKDLRAKLVHWSGAARVGGVLFDRVRELLEEEDGKEVESTMDDDDDDEDLDDYRLSSGPENPKSVAEIFECAGTLVMFASAKRRVEADDEYNDADDEYNDDEDDDAIMTDASGSMSNDTPSDCESGLTIAECKMLALEACVRHLERVLDAHHMDLSERAIDDKVNASTAAAAPPSAGPLDALTDQAEEAGLSGKYLIPSACLDGILEAASLFGLTFGKGSTAGGAVPAAAMQDDADRALLGGFITESFATFLGHVRAVLLEKSVEGEQERKAAAAERAASLPDGMVDAYQDFEDEDDGDAYVEIANALGHLLQSVREVASGLALPEVGLDLEAASGLVDQTVEMTEGMVRRRVTRRFRGLRVRVIKDCIVPFARDAISQQGLEGEAEVLADEKAEAEVEAGDGVANADTAAAGDEEEEKGTGGEDHAIAEAARVAQMVQRASVALSDGMQLFDDTARAILTRATVDGGPSGPVDTGMIKSAVEKNARRFAVWLALVLEIVAGCDCGDPKRLLDLRPAKKVQADDEVPAPAPVVIDAEVLQEDADFAPGFDDEDEEDRAMTLLYDLVAEMDDEATDDARYDLTLAICEMCRLAERSVGENMSRSIASSVAEDNKAVIKANAFFGEGPAPSSRTNSKTDVDTDNVIKRRFLAAASRILQLYAMERGAQAADAACADLFAIATTQSDDLPSGPSDSALNILETAKVASIECANIFGGDRMANPMAPFPDADTDAIGVSHMKARSGSPMKGLQLDVERMFIESVEVFPHSMHMMEFSRNAVVATVLKVAFKSMIEQSRFCSFTPYGYKQMQVDCAFLRHMVLHYVKDDKMADGTNGCKSLYNLLSDVILNVGDRCSERECVGQEEYFDEGRGGLLTPLSIAGSIMAVGDPEITAKFVILEA